MFILYWNMMHKLHGFDRGYCRVTSVREGRELLFTIHVYIQIALKEVWAYLHVPKIQPVMGAYSASVKTYLRNSGNCGEEETEMWKETLLETQLKAHSWKEDLCARRGQLLRTVSMDNLCWSRATSVRSKELLKTTITHWPQPSLLLNTSPHCEI